MRAIPIVLAFALASASRGEPPVIVLDTIEPFAEAFDAGADQPRVVALLSPT